MTNDNLSLHREQFAIQKSLSNLLTQLLSEVQRRDEDNDIRRQEFNRIREQNHCYQQRLQSQSRAKVDSQPAQLSSPTLSPSSHSRPNSFLSVSSSSDHHDDDPEVVMKPLKDLTLKPRLSDHVASCNSNVTSPQPLSSSNSSAENSSVPLSIDFDGSDMPVSACEEFADAVELITDLRKESSSNELLSKADNESKMISNSSAAISNDEVPEDKDEKIVSNKDGGDVTDEAGSDATAKTNGHGSNGSFPSSNSENTSAVNPSQHEDDGGELDKSIPKTGKLGDGDGVGVNKEGQEKLDTAAAMSPQN